MICKKCGSNIIDGSKFCTNCGASVEEVSNQQQNYQVNDTLTKKEIKRIEKEEKILKAREIIGTDYLVTLILINVPFVLLCNFYLNDYVIIKIILGYVWYLLLPLLGAYLIKLIHFKKLQKYITLDNYKKIKRYSIMDLVILGFFHVGINLNIFAIPVIISYVLSVIYIMYEMDKIYKTKLGVRL